MRDPLPLLAKYSNSGFLEAFIGPLSRRKQAKKLVLIDIIKDTHPFPYLLVPKPGFDQFEHIDFRILTTRNFDLVRDIPETLLEPGFVTRMDLEDPCCRRFGPNPIGVFDGKLRFSSSYKQ
ncbi:hypothetical protein N7486_004328 [Penicillium sp. IBT 16267x]|nr:hypothetical protein N7486_004328 [Penicillium sp. IBT 16267x]